jgi:hypothetical protein
MADTYAYQRSSKTLISTYHNIRRHIPENRDINKHNFCSGNLKSHAKVYVLQSPVETVIWFLCTKCVKVTHSREIVPLCMFPLRN